MSSISRAPWRARSLLVLATAAACISLSPAQAQVTTTATAAAPLTLSDVYRIAVARQPWTLSRDDRAREQRAREAVANSWLADSPTLASGIKTGNRDGQREFEIEISAPIATASRRALQVATARSESSSYSANIEQEKLKLAGVVRDTFWAVQLAASEQQLADDEVLRAEQMASDSTRRTAAGETARVDTLQAQVLLQTARGVQIDAAQRFAAAGSALSGLLGEGAVPRLADTAETRTVTRRAAMAEHPSLRLADESVQLARSKLNEASGLTKAAPSVSLTLANERSNSSANATTARIGISVPFGGAQRASQRIAQAGAELAEAQATTQLLRQQLEADAGSAEATYASFERRIDVLAERVRLANEVADLYGKAYRLGELDLPTRLRAEGERAVASLALSRARIELKHALSRVNQSLGLLP